MLVGAWGARAGKLLERAAARRHARIERAGSLSMLRPPDTDANGWRCWLFGAPEFPVVAFERDRNRCLIARDQLGAQPLVWVRAADGLLFAEHERDLLDLLPSTPPPDRLSLLQWVQDGLLPRGRTLYEGVQCLAAGHRLVLAGEQEARIERWWNIGYEESERESAEAMASRLRQEAFAAVTRAAGRSRRVAVTLSGGLDSACVAAGLAAGGWADGRAQAIGGSFAGHPLADETELIEETARHTRLPLHLVGFDPRRSMLAPALAHIARWRLPPATPTLFLWQPLTACARELGFDLVLDGEGGDELFGIAPCLIADALRAGRLPTAWSLSARVPGIGLDAGGRSRMRVLRRYGLGPLLPAAVQRRRSTRVLRDASRGLVGGVDARALAELRAENKADRREGPLWWRRQVESVVDTRGLLDIAGHLSREASDAGMELRHPFMYDLSLVEAVLRIPPQAQFDPVRDRPVLRDALAGLIPEAVRTRHVKSHFNSLLLSGMLADEDGLLASLRRADAPIRGYVAPAAVEEMAEAPRSERSMADVGALWNVAIANRWLQSFS